MRPTAFGWSRRAPLLAVLALSLLLFTDAAQQQVSRRLAAATSLVEYSVGDAKSFTESYVTEKVDAYARKKPKPKRKRKAARPAAVPAGSFRGEGTAYSGELVGMGMRRCHMRARNVA